MIALFACITGATVYGLTAGGCMTIALLLDSKRGSDKWHQEMSLRQHVEIVEREFAVSEPVRETHSSLSKLGVKRHRIDRSPEWVRITQSLNPAAQGVPRLMASLYPPYRVTAWSPTNFTFYFDGEDRLQEIWAESIGTDEIGEQYQLLMARSPEMTTMINESLSKAGRVYIRVLPLEVALAHDLARLQEQE